MTTKNCCQACCKRAAPNRIERGLKISLKNGDFKKLFLQHHGDIIQQADLKNRKMFMLENPTLPEGTPEPNTDWWLEQQ
ncbi:MAG: hypothetical protein JEZ12_20410 [Desulfobacterium sp.]|nr:hypothetical protein [Desulfobacterium sp.]